MPAKFNPFANNKIEDSDNVRIDNSYTEPDSIVSNSTRSSRNPDPIISKENDELADVMAVSDEELMLKKRRSEGKSNYSDKVRAENQRKAFQDGEAMIDASRKEHSKLKGIKSARYITTDIIMSLDEKFFIPYLNAAVVASEKIMTRIIDEGSDDISHARANPTDEALQDKAYKTLYAAMFDYLQKNHKELNKSVFMAMIVNEILGFSVLDPLWRDRKIDEILCNGPYDIQVEIKGKLHKVPAIRFKDREHMYALLEKLFGSINKSVSQMSPIVDGRMHDKSRLAVVHHVAAPEGPNFSIRRHPERHILPTDIINYGAANKEMMTDLGNWINKGCSVLVVGGTGSGKTTNLNALSGFFPENQRIVTLEDNIEMMLNPNKMIAAPMEVVLPKPDRPNDAGVTMRDLLRASLRLRPNGIVVGEVRDAAAYDLIQALNTGHWGMSTLHANTASEAMGRLASLSTQSGLTTVEAEYSMIASAFDLVVMVSRFPEDHSRKIVSIEEVGMKPVLGEDNEPYLPTKPLWKFIQEENKDPRDLTVKGEWKKLSDMSDIRKERKSLRLSRDKNWEELQELFTIK